MVALLGGSAMQGATVHGVWAALSLPLDKRPSLPLMPLCVLMSLQPCNEKIHGVK